MKSEGLRDPRVKYWSGQVCSTVVFAELHWTPGVLLQAHLDMLLCQVLAPKIQLHLDIDMQPPSCIPNCEIIQLQAAEPRPFLCPCLKLCPQAEDRAHRALPLEIVGGLSQQFMRTRGVASRNGPAGVCQCSLSHRQRHAGCRTPARHPQHCKPALGKRREACR